MVVIDEENDYNKAFVYVKGRKKRWLVYSIATTRQLTLDADYEDIDSLHKLDVIVSILMWKIYQELCVTECI